MLEFKWETWVFLTALLSRCMKSGTDWSQQEELCFVVQQLCSVKQRFYCCTQSVQQLLYILMIQQPTRLEFVIYNLTNTNSGLFSFHLSCYNEYISVPTQILFPLHYYLGYRINLFASVTQQDYGNSAAVIFRKLSGRAEHRPKANAHFWSRFTKTSRG